MHSEASSEDRSVGLSGTLQLSRSLPRIICARAKVGWFFPTIISMLKELESFCHGEGVVIADQDKTPSVEGDLTLRWTESDGHRSQHHRGDRPHPGAPAAQRVRSAPPLACDLRRPDHAPPYFHWD